MKRFLSALLLTALCGVTASGQNNPTSYIERAFTLSSKNLEGTARSVSMGNAFTALGGDMGSIEINPAASAVYRYSEVSVTPVIANAVSKSNYAGGAGVSDNLTRFGVGNAGFIGSFETGRQRSGLIRWSLGVVMTKQNNLTYTFGTRGRNSNSSWLSDLALKTGPDEETGRRGINANDLNINSHQDPYRILGASDWVSILGWNTTLLSLLPNTSDQYIAATENMYYAGKDPLGNDIIDIKVGGALNQDFLTERRGSITSTVINFGGNIANKLYFGVNLGLKSVYEKIDLSVGESAVNSNDFDSGFESFRYAYEHKTFGTGADLKMGIIFTPTPNFRVGAAIATPTFYWLTERYYAGMRSAFNDGYTQLLYTPEGEYDYTLQTPFSFNIGLAGVLPGIGAISADYEMIDYSSMKLRTRNGYTDSFIWDNDQIKSIYQAQHILRVGVEVTPVEGFAIRGGYQYYSNPYKSRFQDYGEKTNLVSAGLGYSHACGFFFDAAFQTEIGKNYRTSSLYEANNAPVVNYKTNLWRLLFTVGFRF